MIRKNTLRLLFLLIFCVSNAAGTVTHSENTLTISGTYNISSLCSEINNNSVLEFSNNQYIFKDCQYIKISSGSLNFSGANVSFCPSWMPGQEGATAFSSPSIILDDSVVSEILYYDTSNGIMKGEREVDGSGPSNLTLKDIYLYNVSKESFQAYQWNNCTVNNITSVDNGWELGDVGFGWYGGNNNHMYNITADGTARSGLDFTDNATNSSYEYFDISQARHGFVDFHGSKDCWVAHGKIHDGNEYTTAPVIISGGIASGIDYTNKTQLNNNTVDDIFISNYTGDFSVYYNVWNDTITNVTSETSPFVIIGSANIALINCSTTISDSSTYDLELGNNGYNYEASNCSIIDCHFEDRIGMYQTIGCSLINTAGTIFTGFWPNDFSTYYYPNITVKNLEGQPITNATITVNTTAKNGYGQNQTEFLTDSNGKLYSAGNRTNWLAVIYQQSDSKTAMKYTSEITATKDGKKNSTVITPDPSWYSPDPSDLQGAEILLTLDIPNDSRRSVTVVERLWNILSLFR